MRVVRTVIVSAESDGTFVTVSTPLEEIDVVALPDEVAAQMNSGS